jgi:hypothetical protein
MQRATNEGRRFKRPKPLASEPQGGSITTSKLIPSGRTVEDCISSECATDDFLSTNSAVFSSKESTASEALANNVHCQSHDEMVLQADIEFVDQDKENYIHALDYDDGMDMLERYFSQPALEVEHVDGAVAPNILRSAEDENGHQNCSSNQFSRSKSLPTLQLLSDAEPCTTQFAKASQANSALETHNTNNNLPSTAAQTPLAKRAILDESGHRLEDIMKALDNADDTNRIPNSYVPGVLDYLHATSTSTDYSKILSSISINCVRYNRQTARPTLDIAQERLQNHEKHELERIAVDRQQMNMALPARIASERNLQQYAERLKKATENTIARLDIRDLAEKEFLDAISEPTELTGEFREESDYTSVINHIEKGIANDVKTQQRSLWRETYFWLMIQQRAKMIGPLPVPPGRKTLITPQERIAAKQLVLAMGHGTCRDNVFKWTSYWRLLSELRLKGAITLLLYRSSEFKTHFFRYTKELDMLLSWNHTFDFPLQQLRVRVIAEEGGDFSGKCDIDDKRIFERLRTTQSGAWANNLSVWGQDQQEYKNFLANHSVMATSGKSNEHILRHGIKGKLVSNRSVFVGIIPYEGESEKRVIGSKPASTKLYSISPLVSVAAGDLLGIFYGKLRYIDQKPSRAVRGHVPGLWLAYSEIPGKLNRMRVAKPGEKTNVCLAWEGVNEIKDEKSFCQNWRILVVATREILPFDQLIRPP